MDLKGQTGNTQHIATGSYNSQEVGGRGHDTKSKGLEFEG